MPGRRAVPQLRLRTDRFILRSLSRSDAEPLVSWLSSAAVTQYLSYSLASINTEAAIAYIAQHDNYHSYLLGIFTNLELHVGNVTLKVDHVNQCAEIGVIVGDSQFWGAGVVQEVRTRVLEYSFDVLKLHKVWGQCQSNNAPMIWNYQHQGWLIDGVRRQHIRKGNEWLDLVCFAMFKDLWCDKRK
jgi:ribosomal-protein-alanine N-acetyltransferase